MRVPNGPLRSLFFFNWAKKWATLLALISVKKEQLAGFEPWSAQWEGRELPLSYNMISVPLVFVIHLIIILMVHHPHLNLQNNNMILVPLVYVIHLINILMVHHPHLNLQNKKRCTHGIRNLVSLVGREKLTTKL
jgi:hypothetical protein